MQKMSLFAKVNINAFPSIVKLVSNEKCFTSNITQLSRKKLVMSKIVIRFKITYDRPKILYAAVFVSIKINVGNALN